LSWRGQSIYISSCLAHQDIALERVGKEAWRVIFIDTDLGLIARAPGGPFKFKRNEKVSPMS
jgi:hypothetical protein